MRIMKRTVKIIEEEISELRDKISELQKERFELEVANHNFIGKYIKIKDDDDYTYMYVYDMFLMENERVLIRGVSFYGFNCEYWDGSYFEWSTDYDMRIDVGRLSEVEESSEEEYNQKFNEAVGAFLKHKREFVDNNMKAWINDD